MTMALWQWHNSDCLVQPSSHLILQVLQLLLQHVDREQDVLVDKGHVVVETVGRVGGGVGVDGDWRVGHLVVRWITVNMHRTGTVPA